MIATHTHEDHLGGLDNVLEAYQVDKMIDSGDTAGTVTFKDYLTAVTAEPNCNYMADEDMTIDIGNGASLKIIEALDGVSNANNDSVIALLDYNNFEALFSGDSESAAEAACLNKLYDVDVLKAGHHGSRTASSQSFLNIIKPETVINVSYVGNSNTMKFHLSDCSSVPTISPEHIVFLDNRSDAISKGYVPCKRCNP